MRYALFKEVLRRQKRKKRKLNTGEAVGRENGGESDEDETDEDAEGEEDDEVPERMTAPPKAKAQAKPQEEKKLPETQSSAWVDDGQDVQMAVADDNSATAAADAPLPGDLSSQR
jgi:DNA replication licensing factor MCM3